jgi:Family of unknown function (DUF5677)
MPGFGYSTASANGRRLGRELLDVTRGYENLVVPRGLGPTDTATLALVARARHLLQRAYEVADAGDDLAAAILMRSITESVFTLAWVNKDPELAGIVWMLDEIRTRLNQHKEVARLERNALRRARRRGEAVAALPAGQSHGLLTRTKVRELRRLRDETRARAQRLPRYRARLNKLKVDQLARMPSFEKRADVGDAEMIYSLTYRFDSNSAAHPNPLALEQFLEGRNADIVIRATPSGARPDPYVVGAVLLLALVELAGERVDHSAMASELARISAELQQLPRPSAVPPRSPRAIRSS